MLIENHIAVFPLTKKLVIWTILILFLQSLHVVQALEFVRGTSKKNGMPILVIRDKRDEKGRTIEGFVSGDALRLRQEMSRGGFREVWLDSGGGSLLEGMKIGRILHKNQAFVRVPEKADCVSSCTVAFLGGVVRVVDPGGTYQVHMFSTFMGDSLIKKYWGLCNGKGSVLASFFSKGVSQNPSETEIRAMLKYYKDKHPSDIKQDLWKACGSRGQLETALQAVATKLAQSRGGIGIELFLYFQEMRNGRIASRVRRELSQLHIPDVYSLGRSISEDSQSILSEGPMSLQRILMDYEMSAVRQVHRILSARNDLGSQAQAALDYLDRMLSARIVHTSTLSSSHLKTLNYDNLIDYDNQ